VGLHTKPKARMLPDWKCAVFVIAVPMTQSGQGPMVLNDVEETCWIRESGFIDEQPDLRGKKGEKWASLLSVR
jgi:hypothetical protein